MKQAKVFKGRSTFASLIPIPTVWRSNVTGTHHDRPAGVVRRFQVIEDDISPASTQSGHVLDEYPPWLQTDDESVKLGPESAAAARDARAFPRA